MRYGWYVRSQTFEITNALYFPRRQSYTDGMFTLNCVVLVEGEVIDDVLHIQVQPDSVSEGG